MNESEEALERHINKRDYFAAHALASINNGIYSCETAANFAYAIADEMMKISEKEKE